MAAASCSQGSLLFSQGSALDWSPSQGSLPFLGYGPYEEVVVAVVASVTSSALTITTDEPSDVVLGEVDLGEVVLGE